MSDLITIFEWSGLDGVEDVVDNLGDHLLLEVGQLLGLGLEHGRAHVRRRVDVGLQLVLQLQEERRLRPVAQHWNIWG